MMGSELGIACGIAVLKLIWISIYEEGLSKVVPVWHLN